MDEIVVLILVQMMNAEMELVHGCFHVSRWVDCFAQIFHAGVRESIVVVVVVHAISKQLFIVLFQLMILAQKKKKTLLNNWLELCAKPKWR